MSLLTAVVTGANRGLGLEICHQLSKKDAFQRIYALCRRPNDALTALAKESDSKVCIVENINVTDDNVGTALQSVFRTNDADPIAIDLLIHNAGAYGPPEDFPTAAETYQSQTLEHITRERLTYALQLNAVAPLFITKALLPNLKARAQGVHDTVCRKVIIISSSMGSISDNTSGGHYGYRTAKAAVNMIGKSLAVDLAKDKIAVGMVHPGFVFTGFTRDGVRREGQREVDESVQGVLQAVDEITLTNTGAFLHGNYGEGVLPLDW